MKRIIGLVVTLIILLIFSHIIYAAEIVDSGTCGDNVIYTIDDEGTITISGTGEIEDYAFRNNSLIKNVIIEKGITSIGEQAFARCSGLTSITIEDSVTSIGTLAFYWCTSLISVSIPKSVTNIGSSAFDSCGNLSIVYITDLAAYLNINMGDNESNPMHNAYRLYLNGKRVVGAVNIPDTATQICDYAFGGCDGITSVIIPDNVTYIGERAFENCSGLTSVIIGNGVTSIGYCAFENCSGLTSITIPDSVTSIGSNTFARCNGLTNVTIGKNVVSIGNNAFYGCESLTSLNFNAVNCVLASFSNLNLMTVAIGNDVTDLPQGIFSYCSKLKKVYISKATTEIESRAFYSCTALTTVEYEGSREEWQEMYIGADNDNLKSANIIYNSTLYISNHTELGAAPQISVTKSDTSYSFDVVVTKPCINSYIYAVIYDIDGNIKEINRVPLELTDNTRIEVYQTENDKIAKIFVWTSNMQPITEAEEVTL